MRFALFGLNSLLIGALFISCHKKSDLESALPRAGDNRPKLEKALQRYQSPKDSLKRQAAEFLIANMPGHFSFDSSSLKYYRPILHLLLESKVLIRKQQFRTNQRTKISRRKTGTQK